LGSFLRLWFKLHFKVHALACGQEVSVSCHLDFFLGYQVSLSHARMGSCLLWVSGLMGVVGGGNASLPLDLTWDKSISQSSTEPAPHSWGFVNNRLWGHQGTS
jgi:hypothetical protein